MKLKHTLLDIPEFDAKMDDLWLRVLPEDGRQMLADGVHPGYVWDVCMPDRGVDVVAERLRQNLGALNTRTSDQVDRFFAFFAADEEMQQESAKPGGTSLFDRVFGLSKHVGMARLQALNLIIMGQRAIPDLRIVDVMRVLSYLVESSYLVAWVMTDPEDLAAVSPLDQMVLRHDVRAWHQMLDLVDQGRL